MIRILGPTGRRLHRVLPGAILSALLLSLLVAVSAQAVHKTGAFQLDGDAQVTTGPSLAGDDWDNICASNPTTCTFQSGFSASASTTATASAHISDTAVNAECAGGTNCTVFTGGGSKDPQEISSWNWKTDSGGLPAKDNLAHGFAARYSLPSTGPSDPTCPSTTAGTDTCKLLYFGSDRIDNSGDAQEGFWFFQNAITLNTDGTFSGLHAVGDLLVLSDFSNGGGTSTINIYQWVASGGDVSTHLLSKGGGTNQACNFTPPIADNDPFCGLVNAADGTAAPWRFTDKSGNHTYLNGELYEGGINLSAPSINLGGECFASIASETRSSTSPTATLKDFVLGGFGHCESGTVTTPLDSDGKDITNGSVSITTAGSINVKDQAVVTVTGASIFGGSVTFHLCGPGDLAPNQTQTTCDAGGALIGSKSVSPPSPVTVTSALAAITSAGNYCWRGEYSGDAPHNVPASSDHSSTECFTVTPVQPTLTTTAGTSPVNLGQPITDTAKLNGTANQPGSPVINPTTAGVAAAGTITFTLVGPGDCTSVPSGFVPIVDNVSGDSDTAYTASFTPTQAGKYTWIAIYSGNSPNTLGAGPTGCPDSNEAVTVQAQPTISTAQTFTVKDSATVTAPSGGNLAGNLRFRLYPNADCSGTTTLVDQSFSISGASTVTKETTPATITTSQLNLSWLVEYSNTNPLQKDVTSTCATENASLSITNGS